MRAVGRRYPQVGYWSIQNEPNQPGWLDPQWVRSRGALGRGRRRGSTAGWPTPRGSALQDTGHGNDTILIGETAPKGVSVRGTTRAIAPGRFIKGLYCLDDHLQLLRGAPTERGCPAASARVPRRAPRAVPRPAGRTTPTS